MNALPVVAVPVMRLLARSFRFEWTGLDRLEEARKDRGQVIYALWHGRFLPLALAHRDRGIRVMASLSRDGERIAGALHRLGFRTARGSSSRGGAEALAEMVRLVPEGGDLGITPDGPRGPARKAAIGAVLLAKQTGLPIVPLGAGASRRTALGSWDAFEIPHPFSRVVIAHGEPIRVSRTADEREMEAARLHLESAIDQAVAEADRLAHGNSGQPGDARP